MEIETKCKVGDLVTLARNEQTWRVIAIHTSIYTKDCINVVYDLQNQDGRRITTQEQKIEDILV